MSSPASDRRPAAARISIPTLAAVVALLFAPAPARAQRAPADAALVQTARAIHERVIVLDTHNDIDPRNFTAARNYTQRIETQVNLPKMVEGGLDASFFIVYVGQPSEAETPDALTHAGYERAYRTAIEKFAAIHRLTGEIAPDAIELASSAADVRRINAAGKRVALIGVENGYPLGENIARVREFYDRGARYLSLAHNGNNQLSDSNTGERDGYRWNNGISPAGQRVIEEMNRVGLMIDVSHVSKGSMLRAAALSKAPIIASHSAVRALCDVSRNLDDEQLRALANTGGVIQMVAFGGYIQTPKPDSPARIAALAALSKSFGVPAPPPGQRAGTAGGRGAPPAPVESLAPDRRAEYDRQLAAIDKTTPADRATVADFVDHIDYAVKLIGIDHVGISSDFDGGGGISGWNDASETFNVTLELVRRGYTEAQVAKLWSENLLRVMDRAQAVARELTR
ncbi:MAG: membrane dipeptidase [Luteitalea sp.]|nr:membrane dipeptidase [Luteitalea sp.]